MKITSRELSLLIALASLFLIYLLYTFLFNPLIQELQVTKDALETVRNQKIAVENNAQNIEAMLKQQDQLKENLKEKTADFLPDLSEDLIITFMASTVNGGGPALKNLTFSPLATIDLAKLQARPAPSLNYRYKELAARADGESIINETSAQGSNSSKDNNPQRTVLSKNLTVQFENTSYEQLISQLISVEKLERAIIVDSLDFSRNDEGFSGSVSYIFYGMDKPELIDEGLPTTPMTDPAGKGNPFS